MAGKKKGAKEDDATADEESDETESGDSGDEDKKDKKKDKDGSSEEPSARAGYIGLGLVGSLVVGFDPLRDAFQGNGSFENAIFRFLACVAVCVVGAGTIGRLIDASSPKSEEKQSVGVELDADGNPIAAITEGESGQLSGDVASDHGADAEAGANGDGDQENDGQTISSGSANSDGIGRQEIQQPLTSSEEMS